MKKQQKENQEIARIIEREQIISYKRKPTSKGYKESDDQIQSANSLKSGVFSDDSVRFSKKNTPLPELHREKKKLFTKNLGQIGGQQVNNYLEKQVRQHDNLVLKQKNNHLTSENMKLKTRVMALEKQNIRLNKMMEDQSSKPRQPGLLPKDNKFKGSQNLSLKMAIKNLRKQLDEQKKQNQKIKWSIKFTRINQLQCERDAILTETSRLRQLLDEQQFRKMSNKHKQQGTPHLEHKLHNLGDRNLSLMKQNSQLQNKLKKIQDSSKKFKQSSQTEKSLNKMLFNAKKIIKDKQRQIDALKASTQGKIESANSLGIIDIKSSKQVGERGSNINRSTKDSKDKRVMSKSAQKYRKNGSSEDPSSCQNCQKLKQHIGILEKKIQDLTLSLQKQKQNNIGKGLGDFRRQQIEPATEQNQLQLIRFLTFRFKAHHLTLQQAERYLINSEINQQTLLEQCSVMDIAQSLVAQPFCIISNTYLQICLMLLFYPENCFPNQYSKKIQISEEKKLSKKQLLENFQKILKNFQLLPQQKQQQMFIQIAQLVTNYHQHILTALNRKKNGEGTITQLQFCNFFNQIQLQKQFVDFIICQIILESLDLQHLNYYAMFEIFYMPNNGTQANVSNGANQPNKKKFQVDHSQVVKQQDEEYQQSRSYVDAKQKQKTHSKRQDQSLDLEDNNTNIIENVNNNNQQNQQQQQYQQQNYQQQQLVINQQTNNKNNNTHNKDNNNNNKNKQQDEYEQYFEEQKMEELPQQEKAHQQEYQEDMEEEMKPYVMEEVEDNYQEDNNGKNNGKKKINNI